MSESILPVLLHVDCRIGSFMSHTPINKRFHHYIQIIRYAECQQHIGRDAFILNKAANNDVDWGMP